MLMCFKLTSLYDSERKVCFVTQVLKQGINIKTMCPNISTYSDLETRSRIYSKFIYARG